MFFHSIDELVAVPEAAGAPIILLGQSLQRDGAAPQVLLNRIAAAADVHERTGGRLLLSGGDVAQVGETEASVMQRLLAATGRVQPEAAILDHDAWNTLENALNTAPVLRRLGCETAVLVTSDFHVPRSCLLFEAAFAHSGFAGQLLCLGAPSGHVRGLPARTPPPWEHGGPREDISQWRMAERVGHELELLDTLVREWLAEYRVPAPPEARFQAARQQLQSM